MRYFGDGVLSFQWEQNHHYFWRWNCGTLQKKLKAQFFLLLNLEMLHPIINSEIGYNYRMSNICAGGRSKWKF
jgi:hypothetical protein